MGFPMFMVRPPKSFILDSLPLKNTIYHYFKATDDPYATNGVISLYGERIMENWVKDRLSMIGLDTNTKWDFLEKYYMSNDIIICKYELPPSVVPKECINVLPPPKIPKNLGKIPYIHPPVLDSVWVEYNGPYKLPIQ